MAKVGRPPKVPEGEMPEIVAKLERYIEETDIPIVAEFAYQNNIDRTWLYDQPQLSTLLKKLIAKKEVVLEKGALQGTLEKTMAIFSLKQLGWRDKEAKVVFVDPKTLSDDELKKLIQDGG